MAGFVVVLPLVLRHLSSEDLGIWYVFIAVSNLIALLDMGFTTTITRAAGYSWAGASTLAPHGLGKISQQEPNLQLLSQLVSTSQRFYQFLALAVLVGLGLFGTVYIWMLSRSLPHFNAIIIAWAIFVIGNAVATLGSLWPAMLTGIDRVKEAQKIQLGSILLNYAINIILLISGFGIFGPVLGRLAEGIATRHFGKVKFFHATKWKRSPDSFFSTDIFSNIWPMAWRSGIVSIGTFLILNANTLIISSSLGLEEAASYGLTAQLIGVLLSLSSVWVTVSLPRLNQLRATNSQSSVINLFIRQHRLSLLTFLAGAIVLLVGGVSLLKLINAQTALLSTPYLSVLLLINFLELNHGAHGSLVLTENKNPFVFPSLLTGIANLFLGIILVAHLGIWGIILSQGLVQLAFNNWWPILRAANGVGLRPTDYFRRFFLKAV